MVEIAPLKGLFYNLEKFKDISTKLAPPYDIISEKLRADLFEMDPYNIINLTLPKKTNKISRYENSKRTLGNWVKNKILVPDKYECFYIFEEEFLMNNKKKRFLGFIGLLNFNKYKAGKVLRHEKTLSKPTQDRLNLLKSTRTNFEFIYTIYNDTGNNILNFLNSLTGAIPFISTPAKYDSSLYFRLWKISNNPRINKIIDLMKDKNILIADGHHRYETSRLYKKNLKINNLIYAPEDYILTLFVSGNQKDLVIYPTNRVIIFKNIASSAEIINIISKCFLIKKLEEPSPMKIENEMKKSASNKMKAICLYFSKYNCYLLTLKDKLINIYKNIGKNLESFDRDFEYLDVNILHNLILKSLLEKYKIHDIKFFHKTSEVLQYIDYYDNKYKKTGIKNYINTGFILNPPSISVIQKLSNKRKIMPQKSTYFYPKPCSGLVMYKFDNN